MNPRIGWTIAFIALVAGWFSYGVRGLALAFTLVAFALLLQFNRSVRVMRNAAESPVGRVGSAVMLQSRLSVGLNMLQIVSISRALGRQVSEAPDTWVWADDSGAQVQVVFEKGRCVRWSLVRESAQDDRPDLAA